MAAEPGVLDDDLWAYSSPETAHPGIHRDD